MNRRERRISQKEGRRRQALKWDSFKDVTKLAIEKSMMLNGNTNYKPEAVFQNNKYIVQIFYSIPRDGELYTKVMCRRSDAKPIYSWHDLYRIKNDIFGEEIEAIQFMPKVSELVDSANLYWFWIKEDE